MEFLSPAEHWKVVMGTWAAIANPEADLKTNPTGIDVPSATRVYPGLNPAVGEALPTQRFKLLDHGDQNIGKIPVAGVELTVFSGGIIGGNHLVELFSWPFSVKVSGSTGCSNVPVYSRTLVCAGITSFWETFFVDATLLGAGFTFAVSQPSATGSNLVAVLMRRYHKRG